MRRFWIILLAIAVALVIALPAGAKKPDKPANPNTGFKPMACEVDVPFLIADVRNVDGTTYGVEAGEDGAFTLTATEAGGFNETWYTVETGTPLLTDVLCVKVELDEGTVKDLRVRWLDCHPVCGLYRATGKDLRNFNNHVVFSAGVSVADWTTSTGLKTVAVMPVAKSDTATMKVTIGIDNP